MEEQVDLWHHISTAGRSLAPYIDPHRGYAFQPMTPAALANFKLQGRVQGDAIRALAGLTPANAGPAAVSPAQAMPAAPAPAPDGGAVADTWIAMVQKGDIVVQKGRYRSPRSKPSYSGKHVVGKHVGKQSIDHSCREHPCSDEGAWNILVLMKVPAGDVPMYRLQHIRILPVCFDAQG